MPKRKQDEPFSYSTQHGALCPICFQAKAKCRCAAPADRGDGIVRVGRATKGRKGTGVTTVSGFPGTDEDRKAFAKELKRMCGSGGTVRAGVIEVQGEHRDRILDVLAKRGLPAKRVGA